MLNQTSLLMRKIGLPTGQRGNMKKSKVCLAAIACAAAVTQIVPGVSTDYAKTLSIAVYAAEDEITKDESYYQEQVKQAQDALSRINEDIDAKTKEVNSLDEASKNAEYSIAKVQAATETAYQELVDTANQTLNDAEEAKNEAFAKTHKSENQLSNLGPQPFAPNKEQLFEAEDRVNRFSDNMENTEWEIKEAEEEVEEVQAKLEEAKSRNTNEVTKDRLNEINNRNRELSQFAIIYDGYDLNCINEVNIFVQQALNMIHYNDSSSDVLLEVIHSAEPYGTSLKRLYEVQAEIDCIEAAVDSGIYSQEEIENMLDRRAGLTMQKEQASNEAASLKEKYDEAVQAERLINVEYPFTYEFPVVDAGNRAINSLKELRNSHPGSVIENDCECAVKDITEFLDTTINLTF